MSSKKDFIISKGPNVMTCKKQVHLKITILRSKLKLLESKRQEKTITVLIKRLNTMRGACVVPAIITLPKLKPYLYVGIIKEHIMRRASVTNASISKKKTGKVLDCVRMGIYRPDHAVQPMAKGY